MSRCGDPYYGVHADDRAAALAAWEAYEAGEAPYRVEYRLRCSDGREVWVNAYAEMTKDETGRPLTLVGALQDITERKRNELDLMHARDPDRLRRPTGRRANSWR